MWVCGRESRSGRITSGKLSTSCACRPNPLAIQQVQKAQHIHLPLLAARVTIKKALGVGSRRCSGKWSSLRPAARCVLDSAVGAAHGATHVLCDYYRYSPPEPTTLPEPELSQILPELSQNDQTRWATRETCRLHRHLKDPTVTRAVRIRRLDTDRGDQNIM